ncbi:MAG: arylesterase [Desulfonatronovibrionaceae bacterium]
MVKILILGDSLTAGYGLSRDDCLPGKLEQKLQHQGRDVQVINGGVSGDTTSDGLRRIEKLLRHQPDLVLVQFGANDLMAGFSAEKVQNNLEKIIGMCRDQGAEVLLAGIQGLEEQTTLTGQGIHQAFEQAARACRVKLVPDVMPGIPGNPGLTLADGFHPNAAGVELMADNLVPELNLMLSSLRS